MKETINVNGVEIPCEIVADDNHACIYMEIKGLSDIAKTVCGFKPYERAKMQLKLIRREIDKLADEYGIVIDGEHFSVIEGVPYLIFC